MDIEPNTFNMIPGLIGEKITPNTKLIIAQHTYGYPCDMDAILEIAQQHHIPVIEDCCLSLGSMYKDKLVGYVGSSGIFFLPVEQTFYNGFGWDGHHQ